MARETKKQELSDSQIIRRQVLIVAGIFAVLGGGYGVYLWGEDNGWGNADKAVAAKMERANNAYMNRDHATAIAIYEKILKKYPAHPQASQAQTQLALALEEKGDYAGAVQAYQKVLAGLDASKSDMKAYTLLQVGRLTRLSGNYAEALKRFEEVRAFRPGSDWAGEALAESGRAWSDQKDYDKAIATYKQLIKEMPGGFLAAEAQSSIGACFEAMGKDKDAMKAYQVVLDKYPSQVWDQAKGRIEQLKKRLETKS